MVNLYNRIKKPIKKPTKSDVIAKDELDLLDVTQSSKNKPSINTDMIRTYVGTGKLDINAPIDQTDPNDDNGINLVCLMY